MTNRKSPEREGKVQLVDARDYWVKMRKSLGEKRKEISAAQIEEITRLYGDFAEGRRSRSSPMRRSASFASPSSGRCDCGGRSPTRPCSGHWPRKAFKSSPKIFSKRCTSYSPSIRGARFATEKELVKALGTALAGLGLGGPAQKAIWSALAVRDEHAPIVTDRKGNPEPDPELRDYENVPLPSLPVSFVEDPTERFATLEYRTAIDDYMRDEVLPYVPDAWVDRDRTKIGTRSR